MSKEPEVGDVWVDNDDKYRKYIIISTDYIAQTITVIDKHFWKSGFSYEVFIKYFTYLGKSKANIDDLFKTENKE